MSDWIDIRESYPDFGERAVAVWNGEHVVMDCHYDRETGKWRSNRFPFFPIPGKITHWILSISSPKAESRYRIHAVKECVEGKKRCYRELQKDFDSLRKTVKFFVNGIYNGGLFDTVLVDLELGREITLGEIEHFIDEYCEKIVK